MLLRWLCWVDRLVTVFVDYLFRDYRSCWWVGAHSYMGILKSNIVWPCCDFIYDIFDSASCVCQPSSK